MKTARKQNIWDVTRVAAKFCLLYDDGRWEGTEKEANSKDDSKGTPHTTNGNNSHSEPAFGKRSVTEIDKQSQDDTDLLQVITEVHFIHAEVNTRDVFTTRLSLFLIKSSDLSVTKFQLDDIQISRCKSLSLIQRVC